ncbi:heme oxygenase [Moraxella macacae 0408225]|uniref:Heme oxygenase n=1 Tax=Moraxella macacae 0408225 TaxID=1230338 RepID=L2F825_9GAMM|nr:biliverdin-producing heme oxygenase [Moraxella macacae]ELA09219.1 heme oxygenase [Moraxella macacae 0408225]
MTTHDSTQHDSTQHDNTQVDKDLSIDEVLDKGLSFSESLKLSSRQTHDSVDNLVMSTKPFASHDNYRKFLQAQHEFHKAVKAFHEADDLNQSIANLKDLSRHDAVVADMQALDVNPANIDIKMPTVDGAERLGWLYCVEGSNVGAAILYKEAGKIELDENHGASHLAAHEDGRMRHWRAFKEKLDTLNLSREDQAKALQGAQDAFEFYKQVVRTIFH